jgi:hypothetical protein
MQHVVGIGMMVAALIVAAISTAQAQTACATEAQRKVEIDKLNESVDWFLSIVEEVPEGIARQFRAIKPFDEQALLQASAHPLWKAHKVREEGADIKRALRSPWTQTPEDRLRAAIFALQRSAWFSVTLSDYGDQDRGRSRRIINKQDWAFRYTVLPGNLEKYAQCLVDELVSSRAGSGSPAAPR